MLHFYRLLNYPSIEYYLNYCNIWLNSLLISAPVIEIDVRMYFDIFEMKITTTKFNMEKFICILLDYTFFVYYILYIKTTV